MCKGGFVSVWRPGYVVYHPNNCGSRLGCLDATETIRTQVTAQASKGGYLF